MNIFIQETPCTPKKSGKYIYWIYRLENTLRFYAPPVFIWWKYHKKDTFTIRMKCSCIQFQPNGYGWKSKDDTNSNNSFSCLSVFTSPSDYPLFTSFFVIFPVSNLPLCLLVILHHRRLCIQIQTLIFLHLKPEYHPSPDTKCGQVHWLGQVHRT